MRKTAARRRPLIGLTPLIDVVFILLIFFMLASSYLDWRAIDLDAPAQAAASASEQGAILVEVRPDGLRLSGEPLSLDAVMARIDARLAADPEQRVMVRPSAGVALQQAVDVLDRVAAAGIVNLSLVRGRQ